MRFGKAFIGFAVAVSCAVPAFAHHSGAMFDRAKTVSLRGVVREFIFTNPHSWIRLTVTDASGASVVWDIEASAPARLVKWGISPQTVRVGDRIGLTMHPLRDGRRGGSLVTVTLANGKTISTVADVNAQTGQPKY